MGKSYVLKLFCEQKMQDSRNNVIYIDKEKRQFDFIRTYQDLNAYIDENRANDKHNFILIDEIQDIEEFERSIRILTKFRTLRSLRGRYGATVLNRIRT